MDPSAIQKQKAKLRADSRQRVRLLSLEAKEAKCALIQERLLNHPKVREAGHILCYMPLPNEVDILGFMEACLDGGKTVLVPGICIDSGRMEAYKIRDLSSNFVKTDLGFLQPDVTIAEPFPESRIDVVIVPGLAFSRKLERLGRGKGYYDEYLLRAVNCFRLGVAYREQVVDVIPQDKWDVKVNDVIFDDAEI